MVIVGCEGGERPITQEPKQGTQQGNSRDEEITGIVGSGCDLWSMLVVTACDRWWWVIVVADCDHCSWLWG